MQDSIQHCVGAVADLGGIQWCKGTVVLLVLCRILGRVQSGIWRGGNTSGSQCASNHVR